MHKNLHFHPYKLAIVQEWNENDRTRRLDFAQEIFTLYEQNEPNIMVMSNQANFYLFRDFSKQNSLD